MPCESSHNRGARGDSSFMLEAMASSSEKPPLQMRSIKWWEYVTVVVFCRDDLDPVSIIENDPFLSGYRDSFIVLDKISEDAELSEISATKVRNLFRKGDPAYKNYLTGAVAAIMGTMNPEDFPELTFEGWVQIMKNSPSRHAAQMIYKRVYEENRKIIPGMEDIAERIAKAVVYAGPVTADSVKSYGATMVTCENIDILDLARRQKAEGHDPAVVSTACGTDAAGFYASGDMMSKLSENEFCRRSDLSAYLYQFGNPRKRAVKESGVERRECAYPLSKEYGAVYSPGVRFFRENLKENYTLSKTPFSLSVVSAAPLSFLNNGDGLLYRTPEEGLSEEGKEVMFRKFLNIFSIAAVNGHDSVVMDDFGVRSTRLPQKDVAECLYRALSDPRVKGKLRLISIALSEGPRNPAYDYRERSKYSAYYKMADRLGEGG